MNGAPAPKGGSSGAQERLRRWGRTWRRLRRGDFDIEQLAFGRRMSMSQFGEDLVLADLFGERSDGYYVDVGAFDPYNLSNTYNLYRRGWRGINLEPVPAHLERFDRFRPGDVNLAVAIGETEGFADFVVNRGFSSFAGTYRPSPDGDPGSRTRVPVRPLADVLDEHLPAGRHIDLLDVDCEGADLTVLRSNDWDRHRPSIVLAERLIDAADERDDPFGFLEAHGYRLHCLLHLTGVFLAPEFTPEWW